MRHDNIVQRLAGSLKDLGHTVGTEHLYKIGSGNLMPDIVATKSGVDEGLRTTIYDVRVVSGNGITQWHRHKVRHTYTMHRHS